MFHDIAVTVTTLWSVLVVLVPSLVGFRLLLAVVRFARLDSAGRRNWLPARWHRLRWRWLCANLQLSYIDRHRRGVALPGSTSVKQSDTVGRLRFPRARITPDSYGFTAKVKTVPGVGREDFEDSAGHISNAWRCHRVQIHQPRPGRLIVRGLRTDPLTVPMAMADAPAGVYGSTSVQDWRLYVGLDEWGQHRYLRLPGITGIVVGGLPGYGKTSLINSWLTQLAGLPVQLVLVDGKGSGDYSDWAQRAWIATGDELDAAAAALEDVHQLMRSRFRTVLEQTGGKNAWHRGPTPDFPLVLTIVDEAHTFFDEQSVKRDQAAEKHVRTCRTLAGQLVKKGRSVLMLTVFITQKMTGDAIPTAIRDNCGLGLSFAVKTRDGAVASLGESIREYPSFCPTTLQARPDYVGVCTASLTTGQDPFVRIRVPEVTEEAAAERARATASLRRDPAVAPVPDSPAELVTTGS